MESELVGKVDLNNSKPVVNKKLGVFKMQYSVFIIMSRERAIIPAL